MNTTAGVLKTGRTLGQSVRAFYSRPLGWLALIVTTLFLSYGGGGVMFWFHAIYRGEEGPAIANAYHWMFDSTLGFVALTPALFFILPGALYAIDRAHIRSERMKAAGYVFVVGVLFGVVTGPGPFMHDTLVGRTAPLGRLAVRIFGFDPGVAAHNAAAVEHSSVVEGALQVLVGAPTYVLMGLLALATIRALARRTAHR
jgi:hypothetical protein